VTVVRIGGEDGPWSSGEASSEHGVSATEPSDPPLVEVTWRDAWFEFDQPDPEDSRTDYLVTTVGFLVRQGPRFLSIAQEILPDGDGFRAITHIPLAVVQSIVGSTIGAVDADPGQALP
jgi:hypothetical protein